MATTAPGTRNANSGGEEIKHVLPTYVPERETRKC